MSTSKRSRDRKNRGVPWLCLVLLLSWGMRSGSCQETYSISLDSIDGLHNSDTIYATQPITFFFRVTSITGSDVTTTELWNGFRVYSLSGTNWTMSTGAYTSAISSAMMDVQHVIAFQPDGAGADTLTFSAGGCGGLPPTFDEVALAITIGPIDTLYAGTTVCIDTVRAIGLPSWHWHLGWCDVALGDRVPTWSGAHCFAVINPPCPFNLTGDLSADGSLSSADIISMVNYVLKSGPPPVPCPAIADVGCNGSVTSSDIIVLVNHVFKGGAAPCNACGLIWSETWACP